MSEVRYPVPWDLVLRLGPRIAQGAKAPMDRITAEIVARMDPAPLYRGLEHIPSTPPFAITSNHYQRRGLWIAHAASAVAVGSGFPVRWIVTANWPPVRILRWVLPSPGDWLLPRVARAMGYFAVPFAGTKPRQAARSVRALLRELKQRPQVIGIFPEGARGVAGELGPALPGAGRLIQQLAIPVLPARVSEAGGRLVISFGPLLSAGTLSAGDAGDLVMRAIASAPR